MTSRWRHKQWRFHPITICRNELILTAVQIFQNWLKRLSVQESVIICALNQIMVQSVPVGKDSDFMMILELVFSPKNCSKMPLKKCLKILLFPLPSFWSLASLLFYVWQLSPGIALPATLLSRLLQILNRTEATVQQNQLVKLSGHTTNHSTFQSYKWWLISIPS